MVILSRLGYGKTAVLDVSSTIIEDKWEGLSDMDKDGNIVIKYNNYNAENLINILIYDYHLRVVTHCQYGTTLIYVMSDDEFADWYDNHLML